MEIFTILAIIGYILGVTSLGFLGYAYKIKQDKENTEFEFDVFLEDMSSKFDQTTKVISDILEDDQITPEETVKVLKKVLNSLYESEE